MYPEDTDSDTDDEGESGSPKDPRALFLLKARYRPDSEVTRVPAAPDQSNVVGEEHNQSATTKKLPDLVLSTQPGSSRDIAFSNDEQTAEEASELRPYYHSSHYLDARLGAAQLEKEDAPVAPRPDKPETTESIACTKFEPKWKKEHLIIDDDEKTDQKEKNLALTQEWLKNEKIRKNEEHFLFQRSLIAENTAANIRKQPVGNNLAATPDIVADERDINDAPQQSTIIETVDSRLRFNRPIFIPVDDHQAQRNSPSILQPVVNNNSNERQPGEESSVIEQRLSADVVLQEPVAVLQPGGEEGNEGAAVEVPRSFAQALGNCWRAYKNVICYFFPEQQ